MTRLSQLRARALRPLARRRFPGGEPPTDASPVPLVRNLWASPAFQTSVDASTRLGRLRGADVLVAARAGNVEEASRLVTTWIEAHPPQRGDAWDPYPLSARVGNWIAALTLLPELASAELSRSLWRQLQRLRVNVEDDVSGRHVIRNARALVLGGSSFGAADLTRRGIDLLRRELPEQVLRDGGHSERSPSVQLVVLRDLLEIQAASPHSWLAETIERMQMFAAALACPDGSPAFCRQGDVGAPGLQLPDAPAGLAVFESSGFVVARDGALWLAFRCGPAMDALSFQLWWRGLPVLARSAVAIDGREQLRPAKVSLRYAREQAFEASVVLPGRMRHVRRLEWQGNEIWVHDQFEGKGRHRVQSRLVWAPEPPEVELELQAVGEVELDFPASIGFRLRCLE